MIFASILPFITLGFNRLSADGERYTYLPSVFFILALSIAVSRISWKGIKAFVFISLILISGALVFDKSKNWARAGTVASETIAATRKLVQGLPIGHTVYLVGLPDTIGGAHTFRTFPNKFFIDAEKDFSVTRVPIYTQPTREQSFRPVLTWAPDERGGFLNAAPGSKQITGNARIVTDEAVYELWGYDYDVYSSDQVRIIASERFKRQVEQNLASMYIWNSNQLQKLEWSFVGLTNTIE